MELTRTFLNEAGFMDEHGFIVTSTKDGGDTAANEGRFLFFVENIFRHSKGESIFRRLGGLKNALVRHPIQYPDSKDFSRDQLLTLITGMGQRWLGTCYSFRWYLKQRFVCGLGFAPNGDLLTQASFIRPIMLDHLRYLLWVTDIGLVVAAIARTGYLPRWKHEDKRFVRVDADDVGDDLLLSMQLLLAERRWKTPWISLAKFILKRFKRPNKGMTELGAKTPMQGAWRWYCRPGLATGSTPPFDQWAEPMLEKYGY